MYGCYYDEEVSFDKVPTNVSFKNDVLPILTANCSKSGCHDAAPAHEPSLVAEKAYNALIQGNYVNTTVAEDSRIYRIIKLEEMPPSGPLSKNQQLMILGWITDGALNN